jgi:hypothetical protein
MSVDNTTLQAALSTIFGISATYIVPKQGNWWNVQDYLSNPAKPDTWVAYRIRKGKPASIPYTIPTNDKTNLLDVVMYISEIDLQLVGSNAQYIAESMSHWLHRADVQAAFSALDAQLMADRFDYTVTDFFQEGENSVLAYNVRFRLQWTSSIVVYSTGGTLVTSATISGTLIVPS